MLAGVGCGVYSSIEQGLEFFHKPVESLDPDPVEVEIYEAYFNQYQQLEENK